MEPLHFDGQEIHNIKRNKSKTKDWMIPHKNNDCMYVEHHQKKKKKEFDGRRRKNRARKTEQRFRVKRKRDDCTWKRVLCTTGKVNMCLTDASFPYTVRER